MQTFLRRNPPLFSTNCVSLPGLPLNIITRNLIMPCTASTAFHIRPCVPLAAQPHSSGQVSLSDTFRFRRGFLTDGVRPWVALKETRSGSRFAWICTVAAAGDEAAAELDFSPEDSNAQLPEDKPVKFHRRQRGNSGNGVSSALPRCPDLLAIPGIGPRNLRKLVDNGIEGVDELKQLYRDRFFGESSLKMVEYLQSNVGIVHRNHAERITTFIKERVDEELKDNGSSSDVKPQKKRITLCVEGNISVGKTTFLQRIANETLELRDLVEIVPEPIDKWQNVGRDHFNILDAFYAEPERYAYTFQNYVFVTRMMQERETSGGIRPLRLMERSVFTDRMVFVRAVHEAKWMNEMEISIYDSWFDPVVSSLPGLIPDGFVYLRASPDTCHKRMMHRKREEEGGVSLDYLRGLHEKHESWLFPSKSANHEVLKVNQFPLSFGNSLHPDIRDQVFLLEGPNMHPSIQKVPALVLDCEPNIDFSRDIEAKQHYAGQVAKFFEFVKKKQEMEIPSPGAQAVTHGHKSPLWAPDGKNLQELPFQSLDFNLSMPSFLRA